MNNNFEFDVAFSFTFQDEQLVVLINDMIQDRFKTFLYSEQQKMLAGTDGEKSFNEVFSEKSRIVVILYRSNWGKTPWTRIEETAIRNRAHSEGFDFTTFVQLDKDSQPPNWLPKNRIYYNYERWGIEGLVPVIEARITEAGGNNKIETLVDKAERLKRQRLLELKRIEYKRSPGFPIKAKEEIHSIFNELKIFKDNLEDPATGLRLVINEKPFETIEIGYNSYFLHFSWNGSYVSEFTNAALTITLYTKTGHYPFDYKEMILLKKIYYIDINLIMEISWRPQKLDKLINTKTLIEEWISLFLSKLQY